MRNFIFPIALIGSTTLAACSFQMSAGSGAKSPPPAGQAQPAATAQPAPTATTAPPATSTGPTKRLGKRGPTPTPSGTTTTPTTPPSVPIVATGTIFGGDAVEATGFKGNVYWIDAGATKLPDLGAMQPAAYLFAKELNIAPQAFTTGFPGVDGTRKENFAIRYQAPLIVTEAADYDFRLVADDGAILRIDDMVIVDNDGARSAPAEKTGPVHLVAGTHIITVDYLQTTGNVALQVFCQKANEAEKICPTRL